MRARTDPQEAVVVDFDHHSAEFAKAPEAVLAKMREQNPVVWSPRHGGFWLVTGWDAAHEVMRDGVKFSSGRNSYGGEGLGKTIPKSPMDPGSLSVPVELDGAEHRIFMQAIARLLSPARVRAMQPAIHKWTSHFIDEIIEAGRCDLVEDLAIPVPSAVTTEWLGFPPDEWATFSRPVHDFLGYPSGSERHTAAITALPAVIERCASEVKERLARPRHDLMSEIAHLRLDGATISAGAATSIVFSVILGGLDTTASVTAETLVYLARHPDARDALIANPALIDSAAEEFLRVFPSAKSHARTVMEDTTVAGVPMSQGDRVLVSWVAVNRDDSRFPDPNEVVLDRFPNPHATFGLGPHRCLGSHLARVMFKEMLAQVLERMPDYGVIEGQLIRYPSEATTGGWTTAPAAFTPRCRSTLGTDG